MRKLLLLLCCWCSATVAAFAEEQFSTDVPLLRQEQLNSSFWQTKLTGADKLLLSTEQIARRNQQTFNQQSEMQLLQTKMMFRRVLFQGATIMVVVLMMMASRK